MRFEKVKTTLDGVPPEVRFIYVPEEGGDQLSSFHILADRRGVRFVGECPYFESMNELQTFAKALSDAWEAHKRMQPVLVRAPANQLEH